MELRNYGGKLVDVEFWKEYVNSALKSIPGEEECARIEGAFPGSYPTFIVRFSTRKDAVVKLFVDDLYEGKRIFIIEKNALRFIKTLNLVSIPKIVSSGTIRKPNIKDVHFIIMDFMPGKCVRENIDKMSEEEMLLISRQLGLIVRELHKTSPLNENYDREGLVDFEEYMKERREKVQESHKDFGMLSSKMIDEIDEYLTEYDRTCKSLFFQKEDYCICHGDLTEDHIFIKKRPEEETYEISGIIDFGDVRISHPIFEIMAAYYGVFFGKKLYLREFLDSYGWNDKFSNVLEYKSREFSYYAFSFTLLFEFNILLRHKEEIEKFSSLQELEKHFWEL